MTQNIQSIFKVTEDRTLIEQGRQSHSQESKGQRTEYLCDIMDFNRKYTLSQKSADGTRTEIDFPLSTFNNDGFFETQFPQCETVGSFNVGVTYENIDHDGRVINRMWGSHKNEETIFYPKEFALSIANSFVKYGTDRRKKILELWLNREEEDYRKNFLPLYLMQRGRICRKFEIETSLFIIESSVFTHSLNSSVRYILGRHYSSVIAKGFTKAMSDPSIPSEYKVDVAFESIKVDAEIHMDLFQKIFLNKPYDFMIPVDGKECKAEFVDPYMHCSIRRVPADPVAIMDICGIPESSVYEDISHNPQPLVSLI